MRTNALTSKIRSCWLGKMIAGAIGAPFEGVPYSPGIGRGDIVLKNEPNDDLELQLVWLLAAERHGASLDCVKMGATWSESVKYGGCDEYGIALWNLKRGLQPPLTGCVDNWFTDGMGAAIRSEIWACVNAGNPAAAAYYASQDATVDHNGEGVWAEMFLAAAESAAFEAGSVREALETGLTHVSPDCRLRMAVAHVFQLFDAKTPFEDVRRLIIDRFGSHNFTDCVMNVSFVVAALLYGGDDFLDVILKAVNFGMDTDCTAATAGALWAIAHAENAIPEYIRKTVGEEIAVSDALRVPEMPTNVDELTARTVKLALRFADELKDAKTHSFPRYSPIAPGSFESPTRNTWAVLQGLSPDEAQRIITAHAAGNKCANGPAPKLITARSIHQDLTSFSCDHEPVDLYSFLAVPADVKPAQLLFATNAGITAWVDDRLVLNYHGMQKPLPAFHRVEGGGVIRMDMEVNRKYLVRIRLYHPPKELSLSVVVGDKDNHNVLDAVFGL